MKTKPVCPIKPMLAKTYKPLIHPKTSFPAFAQPKLDGYRCLAHGRPLQSALLWSRNQKRLRVPHISQAVTYALSESQFPHVILDGELYLHSKSFQEVQSLITREDHPDQYSLSYHVYDCYDPTEPNLPLEDRQLIVKHIISHYRLHHRDGHNLIQVRNHHCDTRAQYDRSHSLFLEEDYEGSILRPLGTMYSQTRSANLLKRKDFLEDDYYISEINRGQGKNHHAAIFTLWTKDRKEFTVTAHGNYQEKAIPLIHPNRYLGKFLTVKYQELTDDGIPRFPVALGLKNDRRPGARPA